MYGRGDMISMELVYKYTRKYLGKLLELYVTYLAASFMGALASESVLNEKVTVWESLTDMNDTSNVVLLCITCFVILWIAVMFVAGLLSRNMSYSQQFMKLMDSHSNPLLQNSGKTVLSNGGFKWADDCTLWHAPQLVIGVDSDDVLVMQYDKEPFKFKNKRLENGRRKFYEKMEFQSNVVAMGNNQTRYMLTGFKENFDRSHPKLGIRIKKTEWSYCRYAWTNKRLRTKNVRKFLEDIHAPIIMPNSFALHLIIETRDGNVLTTQVSGTKSNDYSNSIAISIGEQVELLDFHDHQDFTRDFVSMWVKRALCEEFGLSASSYEKCFDTDSISVLSLNLEADIFNFSLAVIVKMRMTKNEFIKEVNASFDTKEISRIGEMKSGEIVDVLLDYDPTAKRVYHPSSYLRLLLFYLNKNGIARTSRNFVIASRRRKRRAGKSQCMGEEI